MKLPRDGRIDIYYGYYGLHMSSHTKNTAQTLPAWACVFISTVTQRFSPESSLRFIASHTTVHILHCHSSIHLGNLLILNHSPFVKTYHCHNLVMSPTPQNSEPHFGANYLSFKFQIHFAILGKWELRWYWWKQEVSDTTPHHFPVNILVLLFFLWYSSTIPTLLPIFAS